MSAIATKEVSAKDGWVVWTQTLVTDIERGNLEGAAKMLSCCFFDMNHNWAKEDLEGHREMLTHPLVLANAYTLWGHMVPHLAPKAFRDIFAEVQAAGWKITQ